MRIELHNLDGLGTKQTQVYDLPIINPQDYWESVTNITCPCCKQGIICWAEAGYVPGYRICNGCGRHFKASGNSQQPTLLHVGSRRSKTKIN